MEIHRHLFYIDGIETLDFLYVKNETDPEDTSLLVRELSQATEHLETV